MIYAFRVRRKVVVIEADDELTARAQAIAAGYVTVDEFAIAMGNVMVLANHDEHEEVYVAETVTG